MKKGAYAIIINSNHELLLTKKRETYILPWGKYEEGEDDHTCIYRELLQEISAPKDSIIIEDMYMEVTWITPHSQQPFLCRAYLCALTDSSIIKANNEISELLRTNKFEEYTISDITKQIITKLQMDTLL